MDNKTPNQISRPPVVAVMGHVDHGKSTLLDFIRRTNIVEKEAGGITQHVAAYEVEVDHNDGKKKITFLDTPGHEAFGGIRVRGVRIADIAILVVSAEDGVKAQTLEAIKQIQEAKIPHIVAINKIDLPNANVDKTKYELVEHGVLLEGLGGSVPSIAISAKKGTGVDELLDLILLVAEVEDFKADPKKPAEGFVIEAKLDNKKGIWASLVIKDGSLEKNNFVVAGNALSPVRIVEDFSGNAIQSASFSSAVRIIGWDKVPPVGAMFRTFSRKSDAEKATAEYHGSMVGEKEMVEQEGKKIIPLIIKADVYGTIEAIQHELAKIKNDRVLLKVISAGTGNISESDIKSAGGDKETVVIGFNVKTDSSAQDIAERLGIPIHTSNIIYKLSEWLEAEIKERTPKITVDEVTGKGKILKLFSQTKGKQIVGGKVIEGSLRNKSTVNIVRREAVLGQGKILELQKFKAKTEEVETDSEFGALIEAKIELAVGDSIECVISVTK